MVLNRRHASLFLVIAFFLALLLPNFAYGENKKAVIDYQNNL